MIFNRYNSIDNSYRTKTLQYIQTEFPGETFVVQEKIHGSNFALYTDGENIRYAKRGSFLKEDEIFFTHTALDLEGLNSKLLKMFNALRLVNPLLTQLSIHGELCGGTYPHDDVEKVKNVTKIQKEVKYSPNVEFLAFDVMVNGVFVSMDIFKNLCEDHAIPFLPFLATGSLEECLKYPNEFQTKIPKMLGLPEIEGNTCEGTVIKLIKSLSFGNGSRVVIKNKNTKFSEKEEKVKVPKQKDPLPEHVMNMMSIAGAYATENRLKNVLSHIGKVEKNEFGKLLGTMSKDAVVDFIKDNPNFEEMEKKEQKEVTRFLNARIGDVIRPNFANIIDGNF